MAFIAPASSNSNGFKNKKSRFNTGDRPILSPIEMLGVSGPTLLEGVLQYSNYIKPLQESRNKELVDAAQEGRFQSILALTLPIEVFDRCAGTFGSMHTKPTSSIAVAMTRDGDPNNMQSFPVSGWDAEQLLRLFLMLPLAGLHLITTKNNKSPIPGDPFKKLHDAIMALSINKSYEENADDDRSSTLGGMTQPKYSSWKDEIQKIYELTIEANAKNLDGDNDISLESDNAMDVDDNTQHRKTPSSLNYSWWPTFIEDIIDPKTDDTIAYRFWMFVPLHAPKGICESLRTIMEDATFREKEITEAIKNLTRPKKDRKTKSHLEGPSTTANRKKKSSSKKKGGKGIDNFRKAADIADAEAAESSSVDEDDDPAVDTDSHTGDSSSPLPDEDDDIPLRRYWEAALLDIVKSNAKLKNKRATFINNGDVQFLHKKIRKPVTSNTTTTTDGSSISQKKGKSKVESIYEDVEMNSFLPKIENADDIDSLEDLLAAGKKISDTSTISFGESTSGSVVRPFTPFGKPDTFEQTGYSNYLTVNTAFNFTGYNNSQYEKCGLDTEDCNSILHPANIFAPTVSMTSWCSSLADPAQRDYRSYFDIFDATQINIPNRESMLHQEHKDDPHLWLSNYIKQTCPDVKEWPCYSAALGYTIRKTLREYLHEPSKSERPYNSSQYSRFEACHFKGFPRLDRVYVLSPIITPPWRFDILPRPDFVRKFPLFQQAVHVINNKHNFLFPSQREKIRNLFKSNQNIKPKVIVEYAYPTIALQILYGLSFNTLQKTASYVYQESQQLPQTLWIQSSQQQSIAQVFCKDNPDDAKEMATVDLLSTDQIAVVLSVVSNILKERFLQLASCLESNVYDSGSSRGLLVSARMPSTLAIPSLDKPTFQEKLHVQRMGKIDVDSFFRENNIFLHFRWVSEQLENLKVCIFKTPVMEYSARTKEVRELLHKEVDKQIKDIKKFMFKSVIQNPETVPLTSVMMKSIDYYKQIKDDTQLCWPHCQSNAYKNLSLLGEESASFVTYMTDIFQIHSNIIQAIIIRDAHLASSRYTPSTATQFPNILLPGSAGTGKSILLKSIGQTCVSDTYMEVSASTARAFNVHGCNDDWVFVTEEAGKRLFGDPTGRDNEIVTILKQRTESGLVMTVAYDNSEANAKGGALTRNSRQIICSCQGSNIYATNEDLSQADKALLSRFLICNVGSVNESKLPKGFSLQDRALQGARDSTARDIIMQNGHSLKTQHLYYILVEKMIQSKVIKDVEMTQIIDLIANILGGLRDIIGTDGVANRLMGHIRWNLRTEVIKQAIYAVHADGLVDKYKYNPVTGQINSYSLDILFDEIPKYLFATKEIAIKVLTKFSEQLDKPLRTDILRSLAREAYPGCDLNNAKFWSRNIGKSKPTQQYDRNASTTVNGIGSGLNQYPGGGSMNKDQSQSQQYAIDRNYIVVHLPGTTKENALNNLGSKLNHLRLRTQQLNIELKNLQAQLITIDPETDQNGPKSIPPLARVSRKKTTKKKKQHKKKKSPSKKGKEKIGYNGEGGEEDDNDETNDMDVDVDRSDDELSDDKERHNASKQYLAGLSDNIATVNPQKDDIMQDDTSNSSFSDLQDIEKAKAIANRVLQKGKDIMSKQTASASSNEKDSKSKDNNTSTTKTTSKKRKRITELAEKESDADGNIGDAPVTFAEATYSNAVCCPPVKSKTESPLMILERDNQGYFLAIYEPHLRKYLKFSANSDEESPLMNAIHQSLGTSCLEKYPPEALKLINEVCGNLSPIPDFDTSSWMENTNEFEYLVCSNDTRDIVAQVREELNNSFPEDLKLYRFLRTTTIKRNPHRNLRLYNFTGPSKDVKNIVSNPENNPLVIQSREGKTRVLNYDIDWNAYKDNCERNGVDPLDPEWIQALPRITKLAAIHKASLRNPKKVYNNDALYPKNPIITLCNSIIDAYKQERAQLKNTKPKKSVTENDKIYIDNDNNNNNDTEAEPTSKRTKLN